MPVWRLGTDCLSSHRPVSILLIQPPHPLIRPLFQTAPFTRIIGRGLVQGRESCQLGSPMRVLGHAHRLLPVHLAGVWWGEIARRYEAVCWEPFTGKVWDVLGTQEHCQVGKILSGGGEQHRSLRPATALYANL